MPDAYHTHVCSRFTAACQIIAKMSSSRKTNDKEPWSHWRLEGSGFVWSYRSLPHVHTFVNISSKLA